MKIARLTLEHIAQAMEWDQGARYRGFLGELMPLAADAYDTSNEPFRSHLGASVIGRECAREIWYSFHWTTARKFDARMLRLFNRGHLEEPRFLALLKTIGCTVHHIDNRGKQFRIGPGHRGHAGGGIDAVVIGCPDMPMPILGEFKTHNDASFRKVAEEGVLKAKWEHFVQMQAYMGDLTLPAAIYMATNKNDDALHAEIIQYDHGQYVKGKELTAAIIDAETPPPRISENAGWYKCKFCDHRQVCHGKALPARNCRTCQYSSIGNEGEWWCENKKRQLAMLFPTCPSELAEKDETFRLTKKRQLAGCQAYVMLPSIK